MSEVNFVSEHSVVREIWGKADTILFIFAGASAEFALNKAVDWLYFTGRLPADPLGRLFSTVSYARKIIFSDHAAALSAIDSMSAIHASVSAKRGKRIPEWAYRDVLFMLIDYSIRSFELLERKLNTTEKQEVLDVFLRVGNRMGITQLPHTLPEWEAMRQVHMESDLECSSFTKDLFAQYRKHLGFIRFSIMQMVQGLVMPRTVRNLLGKPRSVPGTVLIELYQLSKVVRADRILMGLILPASYKKDIIALNSVLTNTASPVKRKLQCPWHKGRRLA